MYYKINIKVMLLGPCNTGMKVYFGVLGGKIFLSSVLKWMRWDNLSKIIMCTSNFCISIKYNVEKKNTTVKYNVSSGKVAFS